MEKRTIYGLIAAAVVVLAGLAYCSQANAREYYGKVEVGMAGGTDINGFSIPDDSAFGASLGTAVGPVRLEVGASRISADASPASIHAIDLSATAFIDVAITQRTGVFVGAGADYIQAEAEFGPFTLEQDGTGWHGVVGVAHRINDHMIAEASARYIEADLNGLDASTTVYGLGLRFAL